MTHRSQPPAAARAVDGKAAAGGGGAAPPPPLMPASRPWCVRRMLMPLLVVLRSRCCCSVPGRVGLTGLRRFQSSFLLGCLRLTSVAMLNVASGACPLSSLCGREIRGGSPLLRSPSPCGFVSFLPCGRLSMSGGDFALLDPLASLAAGGGAAATTAQGWLDTACRPGYCLGGRCPAAACELLRSNVR